MKISADKLGMVLLFCISFAASAQPATSTIPLPAPRVSCVLTGQPPQPGNTPQAQYRFDVKTPAFYYVCSSDNAAPEQKLTGVWTAVNTRNILPNNEVLSKSDNVATTFAGPFQPWNFTFQVTMPAKGWPVGEYKIEVYYGDQVIASQNLTVTFNTNAW